MSKLVAEAKSSARRLQYQAKKIEELEATVAELRHRLSLSSPGNASPMCSSTTATRHHSSVAATSAAPDPAAATPPSPPSHPSTPSGDDPVSSASDEETTNKVQASIPSDASVVRGRRGTDDADSFVHEPYMSTNDPNDTNDIPSLQSSSTEESLTPTPSPPTTPRSLPSEQPKEVAPMVWRVLDPASGRIYYYNRATGETSWTPPPGVTEPPAASPKR